MVELGDSGIWHFVFNPYPYLALGPAQEAVDLAGRDLSGLSGV